MTSNVSMLLLPLSNWNNQSTAVAAKIATLILQIALLIRTHEFTLWFSTPTPAPATQFKSSEAKQYRTPREWYATT